MADALPNGNVAPQLAPQQGSTGQPSAPATPSIDPAEFARYKRSHEQYEGARPLIEAATKNGWKDPSDFAAWGGVRSLAEKRGFKADQLTSFLGDSPQTKEPGEPETFTKADVEKMIGEKMSAAQREAAIASGRSSMDADLAELSPEKVALALGDDVPDEYKEFAADGVMAVYYKNCKAYPAGHPLAGGEYLSPGGKEAVAQAVNKAKATFAAIVASQEAKYAGKIGKAATKPVSQTAGGPSNSGKADKPLSGPDAARTKLETLAQAHFAKKNR